MSKMEIRFYEGGTVISSREPTSVRLPGMEDFASEQLSFDVTATDEVKRNNRPETDTLPLDFGGVAVKSIVENEASRMEDV